MAVVAVFAISVVVGRSSVGPTGDIARAGLAAAPTHPLDPLSAEELNVAVGVIERDARFPSGGVFPIVTLQEPTKAEVAAWSPGNMAFVRRAFANVYSPTTNRTVEVVVDLRTAKVTSWRDRPGVQPAIYLSEYEIGMQSSRPTTVSARRCEIAGSSPTTSTWTCGLPAITPIRPPIPRPD
jgi:Cu2+-containing amine oxidase